MKTINKKVKLALIVIICAVLALGNVVPAFAGDPWITKGHSVTLSVPDSLSIEADTTDIVLNFSNYVKDSVSSTKTVVYTVVANNMSRADGEPAMNISLDAAFDRAELQAQVGSYTNNSTSLDKTELAAINPSYLPISAGVNTDVAKKASSIGSGKILEGTIPITYRAVATDDMAKGNQTHLMFVTLVAA
jgi:hypothetical protein